MGYKNTIDTMIRVEKGIIMMEIQQQFTKEEDFAESDVRKNDVRENERENIEDFSKA